MSVVVLFGGFVFFENLRNATRNAMGSGVLVLQGFLVCVAQRVFNALPLVEALVIYLPTRASLGWIKH